MDESCRIQTLCLGCIKICVAAYKTATLKKSNFLGSPQTSVCFGGVFLYMYFQTRSALQVPSVQFFQIRLALQAPSVQYVQVKSVPNP